MESVSSAEFRACGRPGVNPQLAQDALSMVSGGVGTDVQSICDGGVGSALGKQSGNLELSPGKPVPVPQVRAAPLGRSVTSAPPPLFPELSAEFPHLPYRFTELAQQQLAVPSKIRECGKKIVQ